MKTVYSYATKAWHPVVGCTNDKPCAARCWAHGSIRRTVRCLEKDHPERAAFFRQFVTPKGWTGKVLLDEKHLLDPLSWRTPQIVATGYHGDLFLAPDDVIDRVFAGMALCPQHQFLVLTKRPERMRDYLCYHERVLGDDFNRSLLVFTAAAETQPKNAVLGFWNWPLPNVWLGVSVEDQAAADERIPHLLATPAARRWLSLEPMTGAVDLDPYLPAAVDIPFNLSRGLDWVVVGGGSGPGARPMHPDWVRSIRDQCQAAGVPFWFKQWGNWEPKSNFADFHEWDAASAHALVMRDGAFTAVEGRDEPDEEFGLTCADLDGNDYAAAMARIGKKAAGHLLDGKEWREMPEALR